MSASQLLRILQTLPVAVNDEMCVFNTDEKEANFNKISKSTNPFLSDQENENVNFWNNPELETSIFANDFTNNHEDETLRTPTVACSITNRFFIDKHSVECELPELMVCYKESDFRVKDICIDEGIPDEEIISNDNYNNHKLNGDGADMIEASLDADFLKDEWLRPSTVRGRYIDVELNSSIQNTAGNYGPESLMYNSCDEKLDFRTNLQNNDPIEQLASDSMFSLQQEWSLASLEFPKSSSVYSEDIGPQPLQDSEEEFLETDVAESEAEKQSKNEQMVNALNESKMEGSVAFRFDTGRTAKSSDPCEDMNPETIYELPLETETDLNHQDVAPGKLAVANHQRSYTRGEASFSMAGVISELISCSRPMPFAGGISNRSDSSATSNISFSFPTLESDYINSPIRMGKSERRRLQKKWRQGLCCKFLFAHRVDVKSNLR